MFDQKTIDDLKSLQPGAIIYYRHSTDEDLDRVWKGKLFKNFLSGVPSMAGFVVESLEPGYEYLREDCCHSPGDYVL